jgi:hypothetical protein
MPDGFGLFHLVSEPLLERVVKEQRLGRDHPRKSRDGKGTKSREDGSQDADSPADAAESETPMSSSHIDLRI